MKGFSSHFSCFFCVLINLLNAFSKRRLVFIFSALFLEQPRLLAPKSIKYMWLSREINKNCISFKYFCHVSSVECLGNRLQAKKNKLSLSDNLKKTTKHKTYLKRVMWNVQSSVFFKRYKSCVFCMRQYNCTIV